ncbi:hypothetical protein ACMD2_02202 [Ananas comosus]|uniref:Uncharacterized protein n=1 Tax=Ananas comosus TaxID=4615 RepID=A0A199VP59_ANACO|nr:hypothetical protein ACMD2_02202 [Ananas comosus]
MDLELITKYGNLENREGQVHLLSNEEATRVFSLMVMRAAPPPLPSPSPVPAPVLGSKEEDLEPTQARAERVVMMRSWLKRCSLLPVRKHRCAFILTLMVTASIALVATPLPSSAFSSPALAPNSPPSAWVLISAEEEEKEPAPPLLLSPSAGIDIDGVGGVGRRKRRGGGAALIAVTEHHEDGHTVLGLALAHVGDRPTDGDGPAEVGDDWTGMAGILGTRTTEEVVFVRSIVNEARVRRMIGPNVARSILHGPGHFFVGEDASLQAANIFNPERWARERRTGP